MSSTKQKEDIATKRVDNDQPDDLATKHDDISTRRLVTHEQAKHTHTEPQEDIQTRRAQTEPGPHPMPLYEAPPQSELIGQTIGPYLILEEIGAGGMAIVYKARHLTLDRIVAIKEIQRNFCQDPRFLKRFQSEARTAARILHPHVITLYEHINIGTRHFLVLEYVAGGTIYDKWQRTAMPVNEALRAMGQILTGLDAIHGEKIVHRDLKPQNILIDARGNFKIGDFGLAHLLGDQLSTVMGTVRYMPPEACANDGSMGAIDQRIDIYALGFMFYELLLGSERFNAVMAQQKDWNNNVNGWLLWHCNCATRLPRLDSVRPDINSELAVIIEKMIEKDQNKRYNDTGAVLRDLNKMQAHHTLAAEPVAQISNEESITNPESIVNNGVVGGATAPTLRNAELVMPSINRWFSGNKIALISGAVLLVTVLAGLIGWRVYSKKQSEYVEMEKPATMIDRPAMPMEMGPYANMVLIPAGEFLMGSNSGTEDSRPVHPVMLPAYYLDKTEVTNSQYRKFCDATGRSYPENPPWDSNYFLGSPNNPVVGVSWEDARAYAAWVKKRLPTEAEWEKAARGPNNSRFPWGDSSKDDVANLDGAEDGYNYTAPVGKFFAGSPSGAQDMIGNVWEWVADSYKAYPGGKQTKEFQQDYRVVRGGGYANGIARDLLDASFRGFAPPWNMKSELRYAIGFRCAADAPK